MGFSVAILAFALADASDVLDGMGWSLTDHRVGEPVDLSSVSLKDLVSPEFQAANNPHLSAARGDEFFFVYLSLKEFSWRVDPDYAAISRIAPFTLQIVIETSMAASVEKWAGGAVQWSISGASGQEYDVTGNPPVDLDRLADDYRAWWASLPHDEDEEYLEPGELDLPDRNTDLIVERFKELMDDFFATMTGFAYAGNHPPLSA